jgi:hypothetical protein
MTRPFERLSQFFNENDEGEKETEDVEKQVQETSDDSETIIERPPGWGEMYGTYEKPIIPLSNHEVVDVLAKLDETADFSSINIMTPEMGLNKEHIKIHMYTITGDEESRKLVVDVHISDFSEWLPNEKGRFSYPEKPLGQNGPYYMHLEDNLTTIFKFPPFSFNLVEYDEEIDVAIFSGECRAFPLPN